MAALTTERLKAAMRLQLPAPAPLSVRRLPGLWQVSAPAWAFYRLGSVYRVERGLREQLGRPVAVSGPVFGDGEVRFTVRASRA